VEEGRAGGVVDGRREHRMAGGPELACGGERGADRCVRGSRDAGRQSARERDTDPHTEAAEAILAEADELAASTITLAEVMVGAARVERLDEQLEALAALKIQEVPIELGAAAQLARLGAETGLCMPDCCVLHAAATADADALANRDERLSRGGGRARAQDAVTRSR
jgi:predicted nucleic acid-binding protein